MARWKMHIWIVCIVAGALLGAARGGEEPPLPNGLEEAKEEQTPSAEEPALPEGLALLERDEEDEPSLPAGLDGGEEEAGAEPALPPGLMEQPVELEDAERLREPSEREGLPFEVGGFWETRFGWRTQHDAHEKQESLGETRLHIEIEEYLRTTRFRVTSDFIYDPVAADYVPRFERGRGWIDLREANVTFTPLDFMDVRAGRQTLTWGTGDLIFLNDLFPKD